MFPTGSSDKSAATDAPACIPHRLTSTAATRTHPFTRPRTEGAIIATQIRLRSSNQQQKGERYNRTAILTLCGTDSSYTSPRAMSNRYARGLNAIALGGPRSVRMRLAESLIRTGRPGCPDCRVCEFFGGGLIPESPGNRSLFLVITSMLSRAPNPTHGHGYEPRTRTHSTRLAPMAATFTVFGSYCVVLALLPSSYNCV